MIFALSAILALVAASSKAQTILEEDFEVGATESKSTPLTRGEGWTTVNSYSGTKMEYNWYNYYSDPESQSGSVISGSGCAACDGPISGTEGAGPREEILLSPELDLNDTYQLQFSWKVSPMASQEKSLYDLQVRVVTDGKVEEAETVFSIQNESMLRESGVTVFPIDTWDLHTSKIDLSDWKGEKVQLAFVYKMLAPIANIAWIDDITVKKFTPATGPVASVNLDRYDFKDVYIGEKFYSEVFTLTNTGKNGLKITGFDLPTGVTTTLDADAIELRSYDKVNFQLAYEASLTSPASGTAVIKTNGGDVEIKFTATKQFVPDGSYYEGFNAYFPPAGWKNYGWSATKSALEGDQSVYCSGDFSNCYLRSPRLDLSDGGTLKFTYYNQYDGESVPEYDIEVQVSYDGGDNWTTKWVSDYQNGLNQVLTAEVELGLGSDESYVRWYYPAIETDDEGAYEHSIFTLDRVILPHVYGAEGVPGNCTVIAPANNATEVYPKNIVLQWGPAQFATGYKVYVGTNSSVNDLIEGVNVGNTLTYTIPQAAYETTYRWKIVAYNDKGESTTASTWRFTTQKDASVMEFPWEENFDGCTTAQPVPTGWLSVTTSEYTFPKWSPNEYYPYGGKGVSLATGWMSAGNASTLTSPEFTLPAEGKSMSISFVWGDGHPSDLQVDDTGLLKKQNVAGGNGYSDVVFEIYADGEWKQAAYLSENADNNGKKYWREETIDLTDYAGKKVQFRWINNSYGSSHDGAALDNVVINGTVEDGVIFNKANWAAGKINYMKAANSGDLLTLKNNGKNNLKVKKVSFTNANFESSITAGEEIASGEGLAFTIQYNAGDQTGIVEDEMVVEFESGYKATLPVSGETLPEDILFYTFEMNPLEYDWKTDFTQIDVDKKSNHELGYYQTVVENDGGKYAFTQVTNNNLQMLAAKTGTHTIAAAAPADQSAADDWLISKLMMAHEGATFDFYARNLGTVNTVFIGDNDLHRVEVLVNEAGNTDIANFKTVMADTEMPYLEENKWNHYTVDLSAYAGKNIYVALRHTTVSANAMAFFDDLTFTHVGAPDMTGIDSVKKGVDRNAQVTVYTVGGVLVAKGRAAEVLQRVGRGLFVVKTADGQVLKTFCK